MWIRSRYVFGAAIAAVAGVGILRGNHAFGATLASFGFESFVSTFSTTGASYGPYVADAGTGSAFGSHAVATAGYSSPVGNGSLRSLSSNTWTVDDYYRFNVPTDGYKDIMISFDQTSSNNGPGYFKLQYSTDGITFSDFGTYSLYNSSSGFASTGNNTNLSHAFDLSAITALNENSNAAFRLVDLNTVPFFNTNPSVPVSTSGTDRVDNFVALGTAVPEPSLPTLALVASVNFLRRRQR